MKGRLLMDVSIVTPTYNRAPLLLRTWNSIRSQNASFEWIVSDDGSTDDSEEVVRAFNDTRIKYIKSETNQGMNAARNAGAVHAQGRYVMFLDSDDELYPDSLSKMIDVLDQAEPHIGVASFQCIQASNGKVRHRLPGGLVLGEYEIVVNNVFSADTLLVYRREIFDHFLLDGTIRGGQCEFVYQISKKYKFITVDSPGSIVHIQEDNMSSAKSRIKRSSDIARSWEKVLQNHSEILSSHPNAKQFYLNKALYRYIIAGDRISARRLFLQACRIGGIVGRIQACLMMMLLLTGTGAHVERLRCGIRNRKLGA